MPCDNHSSGHNPQLGCSPHVCYQWPMHKASHRP
jgi:hypothetical protein